LSYARNAINDRVMTLRLRHNGFSAGTILSKPLPIPPGEKTGVSLVLAPIQLCLPCLLQ